MDADAAIRATIPRWRTACLERNWDALLRMCTDDIVFAPPGGPAASGSRAARAFLEAFPVMKTFDFSFDRVDVAGDLAVATGSGTFTLEIDGQDRFESIKFADVFRRGSDGSWRYSHVIWNTSTAVAAAAS